MEEHAEFKMMIVTSECVVIRRWDNPQMRYRRTIIAVSSSEFTTIGPMGRERSMSFPKPWEIRKDEDVFTIFFGGDEESWIEMEFTASRATVTA